MRRIYGIAASLVLIGTLSACGRDSDTVVVTAPPPSSPTVDTPAPAATPMQTDAQPASGDYNDAIERVHKATQSLSDSVRALSQRPAGPQRTIAIAQAHQALNLTNQAMAQLPADMRSDAAPGKAAGATGSTGSQPDSPQSVEALQKAAQRLRESVQAMAQEPPGDRRNEAIKAAHQALYDTNQAMIQLPPRGSAK
jgi:hypothetical protein